MKRGYQLVSLFPLMLFFFCVFGAGQDGGEGRGGVGKVKTYRKSQRCQILSDSAKKQNNRTNSAAASPVSGPHDLHLHPPPPLHPAFQQSNTLNLPLFLHAPASPCRPPQSRPPHSRLKKKIIISAHPPALCASFLRHLRHF